jgi:hypothetical protein
MRLIALHLYILVGAAVTSQGYAGNVDCADFASRCATDKHDVHEAVSRVSKPV